MRGISKRGAGAGGAVMVLAVLGGLACGDDAGPVDPLADCLEAAGVSGAAVAIRDFAFSPATLRVEPGTAVTWVNCEDHTDAHTTTSDEGVWGSDLLFPGDTYVRTFEEGGEFPYHCEPHPSMQATVIVEE